ncbi:alkaline shock response membrane anchor protein AmaP [Caldanaerobius polysaccharolyticus]|uniref:alkaline shock response membrane anchor protein AmaP n=1 Tax=Caldanaerobius polysaccharolyticus TaxID=44256 RepID=UPI00146FB5B0|nr:alkaline shock response membrane anchor protein AmaP [Caldanaerobius polysaccharolyticus]
MKLVSKVLSVIYIVSILIIALGVLLIPQGRLVDWIRFDYKYVVVGSAVYLLVSLFLLLMSASGKDVESVVMLTEHGEIALSIVTLENLAKSVINELKDVKEAKVKAHIVKNQVVYYISIIVARDVVIPELSEKLQKQVIEFVERNSGIKVAAIKVKVENVAAFLRHKVE